MPKIKTNSGAKKRFKLTKGGKVKRFFSFKSHLLEAKSPKRKRKLRKGTLVSAGDEDRVKRMIPYK
ncbi:MAG TPA: 50S ribosomal protein L35 [Spirochaetota bacterium]|mgnify:CR=1 FL=1|jgi:large subunit ribosomal protein L35|nr:50S ribosomal protein L35 [Spirochaetota bacterium]HQP48234.1 50S ribosomal protein L35 [Spirochaetota bacterium]